MFCGTTPDHGESKNVWKNEDRRVRGGYHSDGSPSHQGPSWGRSNGSSPQGKSAKALLYPRANGSEELLPRRRP